MRIAVITTGFAKDETDYRGAAVFNYFVKELSLNEGIDLTIFAFYYPLYRNEYKFYNAKVFSFAKGRQSKLHKPEIWRRCKRKFAEEHNKNKFDIIHSFWCGESGYVASQLSKQFNIPLTAAICGGELAEIKQIRYGSQLKFWQKYFVKKTFEQAKIIVAGSDYIIDKLSIYDDGTYLNKSKKIAFGVDAKFTSPPSLRREKDENESLLLINIANVVPVKSHIDLLKAFKIVLQKFSGTKLTCCGDDSKGTLKKLVSDFELTGKVAIKGFVDYEQILSLLNGSDIFVLSSLYESQNMSVIEAAFCGLPIVSTAVGIAPEISPFTCEPGNYELLAEKLLYVISNYTIIKTESESKITEFRERYSMVKCVDEYLKMYEDLFDIVNNK